mgnify:CR=1 FL=1
MKKTLLLLSIITLFVSCKTYLESTKLSDYNKKIEGNLNVYIAIATDNKQKQKWVNAFKNNLTKSLTSRGITPEIVVFEVDVENNTHTFGPEDLKTTNPNGLTLLIKEDVFTTYGGPGGAGLKDAKFTVTLHDKNIDKNIWTTQLRGLFGNVLGGMSASAKTACIELIGTLNHYGLLPEKQ